VVSAGRVPDSDRGNSPDVSEETRGFLRDLLLCLADNKRILGIRYADRMLGSPSLETGIAAASMAQDEWGHSRLTYALLSDFGDDPVLLEHERGVEEYSSMEHLDRPFGGYPEMIAAALLLDEALTIQYEALGASSYAGARNRVQKILEEELLHARFAAAWAHRLIQSDIKAEFTTILRRMLPEALRWFGPADGRASSRLMDAGVTAAGPEALRRRLVRQVGPVLDRIGVAEEVGLEPVSPGTAWRYPEELDWTGWDARRRRSAPGGPEQETVSRVRGDRNRAMLLD
jgi:1,2-phenylacetyl-CoA epoxidase catalytic subunit